MVTFIYQAVVLTDCVHPALLTSGVGASFSGWLCRECTWIQVPKMRCRLNKVSFRVSCSRELACVIPLISFWWACCSGSGNSSILDRLLPSWADSPHARSALSAIAPGVKVGSHDRRPASVASGSPPALLPSSCDIRFERDGGEGRMIRDRISSSADTVAHAAAARTSTSAEDETAGLPYKTAGEAAMQAASRVCGGEGSLVDEHLNVHASPREADRHAGEVRKHDSESAHTSGEHMVGRLHAAEPPVIAEDDKGTAHVCQVQRTCTAMMRITPGCREERVCPDDDVIDGQSAPLLETDTDDEEDDVESVLMQRMQSHEVESRMKRLERHRLSSQRRARGLDATSRPSEECQQVAHRPRRASTRPHSHASQSSLAAPAAAWVGHIDAHKGSSAECSAPQASSDRPRNARPLSFCFTPTEILDTDRNPIGVGRDVQRLEVDRCASRPCHDGLRAFSLTC